MSRFEQFVTQQESIFIEVTNAVFRIRQERISLQKLMNRNDFLSRYNIAIRYIHLYALEHCCDIRNNKVHVAFLLYCSQYLGYSEALVKKIISARHELKYNAKLPSAEVVEKLEQLILQLERKTTCSS